MSENHHENQSDPEFSSTLTYLADGWKVEVSRGGTVRYSDRGFKSRAEAAEVGAMYVRGVLRAHIAATGIGRCAERPAFVPPFGYATLPLEAEQLCTCHHPDGVHQLGANGCTRPGCGCVEFEPVAQVESVRAEVRS